MTPPTDDDLPELNGVSLTPSGQAARRREPWWRRWVGRLTGDRAVPPPASPPAGRLEIVYTPAALPEPDRDGRLLALCRGDTAVYDRLLAHERQRHPGLSRAEHVELAVRLFRRDRE